MRKSPFALFGMPMWDDFCRFVPSWGGLLSEQGPHQRRTTLIIVKQDFLRHNFALHGGKKWQVGRISPVRLSGFVDPRSVQARPVQARLVLARLVEARPVQARLAI